MRAFSQAQEARSRAGRAPGILARTEAQHAFPQWRSCCLEPGLVVDRLTQRGRWFLYGRLTPFGARLLQRPNDRPDPKVHPLGNCPIGEPLTTQHDHLFPIEYLHRPMRRHVPPGPAMDCQPCPSRHPACTAIAQLGCAHGSVSARTPPLPLARGAETGMLDCADPCPVLASRR